MLKSEFQLNKRNALDEVNRVNVVTAKKYRGLSNK